MDQLMAMRAFTRVVESGSFTRAADSLNMPIATLSKLVKSLESHTEIRLLHRTTRRVVATPEGMEYYEKALRVLIDIEDIDTSFAFPARRQGHCGLTWAAPPPGTCSFPCFRNLCSATLRSASTLAWPTGRSISSAVT